MRHPDLTENFVATDRPSRQISRRRETLKRLRPFLMFTLLLALGFGKPLYDLARYAMDNELYSHILLVPFVSLGLIWVKRPQLSLDSRPAPQFAVFPFTIGLTVLAGFWFGIDSGWQPTTEDYLALTIFPLMTFVIGACCLFLGHETGRAIAFPITFLFCMVPFPTVFRDLIEVFFQQTSMAAAYAMLHLGGTPVFRQGLELQLPGFRMEVAQDCSGIRSSLMLFITSLLAGHLFLRSPWKRGWLALAVIPLGILRNGLRIFTIGELCVHVSPDMINSYLHRRGGPVLFCVIADPVFLAVILPAEVGAPPLLVPPCNESTSSPSHSHSESH